MSKKKITKITKKKQLKEDLTFISEDLRIKTCKNIFILIKKLIPSNFDYKSYAKTNSMLFDTEKFLQLNVIIEMSRMIEYEYYNYSIKNKANNINTKNIYCDQIYTFISNINSTNYIQNKDFINIITDSNFKIKEKIPFKFCYDYNPTRSKDLLSEIKSSEHSSKNLSFISSNEECKRCGKNKITISSKMLRSSDEGLTTIFECLNCGARWKKDN